MALAESETEERSAARFETGAAFGGQSVVAGACAGDRDAAMAASDRLSASSFGHFTLVIFQDWPEKLPELASIS